MLLYLHCSFHHFSSVEHFNSFCSGRMTWQEITFWTRFCIYLFRILRVVACRSHPLASIQYNQLPIPVWPKKGKFFLKGEERNYELKEPCMARAELLLFLNKKKKEEFICCSVKIFNSYILVSFSRPKSSVSLHSHN